MEITTLLKNWAEILLLAGTSIVAYIALKGKVLKEKNDLGNKADDRLITILQTTVTNLEKEVGALRSQIEKMTIDLTKLKSENDVLREIFQGRDQNTIDFQKKGLEAVSRTEEILSLARDTNAETKKTSADLGKLYRAIEKHLKVIEEKG